MEMLIAFYMLAQSNRDWPDALKARFSQELIDHVMYFDNGSAREKEFLDLVDDLKIQVWTWTILSCSDDDVYRHPYHYLSVREDRRYRLQDYLDLADACPGDEQVWCHTGATQTSKLVIDPGKSRDLDIMVIPGSLKPAVYVVSARMKQLLESIYVRGCRFVPCLEEGTQYSADDIRFESTNPQIRETASRYQLDITGRARRWPCVRRIMVGRQCSRCATAEWLYLDGSAVFEEDDLDDVDFQTFDGYRSDSGQEVVMRGEIAIVSSRVLRLFAEQRIRGLEDYSVEPRVPYAAVEIQ